MKKLISLLLLFVGCSLAPLTEREKQEQYRVVVENRWTSIMRVSVEGKRRFVNPGESHTFRINSPNTRLIFVQVGNDTFRSGLFTPSPNFPCWELIVDTDPLIAVGTGPNPCGFADRGKKQ